jgi:ribonuclease J
MAKKPTLKYVPLGGLEEIGRNCMFLEDDDSIVILDMGLQFPEDSTPGIDYIIPNVKYLESKKEKIRGLIITHGHYDHIGAIPYVMTRLGNPTIYTSAIAREMILKRQDVFPNQPKLNIVTVKNGDTAKLSADMSVEFFDLDHTIPDTLGIILKTPVGNIVHVTDFRFDYDDNGKPIGYDSFKRIGDMGVHTLIMESTAAEKEGSSVSERVVIKNLEDLFAKAKGRIIVGTFASMITRLGEIIKIAGKIGRKAFIVGFSMKTNLQIAQNLGYLKFEKDAVLPIEDLHKYKDDKVLIVCTGAQGESNAQLMKIATGQHRFITTKAGDNYVLSSSIVPGNEGAVQILKDNLSRQGARVFQSSHIDIHSSGHGPKEDMKLMLQAMKPTYFIPVHGYYFMRAANRENAVDIGMPRENVLMLDNGVVAELTPESATITKDQVESYMVMVDGLGVGDVGEIVLRDRLILADEGMMVMIVTLDRKTGKLLKKPDIISRGFIYLKDNQELVEDVRRKVKNIVEKMPETQTLDPEFAKSLIRDQIGSFLYQRTKRRPMILPVIIEV